IQSFDSDGDGDLNPLFYYMPEDVNIAGEPYGAGLYINGEVNAWGATGRFAFNRAGGLFGSTETSAFLTLERLDLGGLGWFVLEGVDDPNTADVDESDELNFAFNTSDSLLGVVNSSFTADASVKLFGQTVGSGTAKIGTGGIDIDIDIDLFDILTVDASLFVGNPQNDDTIEAVQNADGTTELIQTFTNFGSQGNLILEGESVSTSLSFDGVDDYVELDSDRSAELAADLGSAMTVETWIKVDSFTKTWQAIVVKGDDSWRLQRRRDTDQLIFTIQGVGSTSSSVGVNDGGWHHVAAVYDGSTLKLYIDGELSGQNNASGSIPAGNYNMRIGGNAQFANREFDGQMDEIRIWNIARTQEEIQANLDHRLDPNTSGLIYYLPVDQRDRTQGEGFYETFDNGIPKTIISLPITDNNIGTTPDRYHQVPAETLDFHRIGNWALDTVVTGTNGNSVTNAGTLGAAVDGTVVGTPGTVAGLPENSDGALDFNGSSDGIVIPNNLAINTDSRYAQRSIELWFKADTLEGQQVIYEQGGAFNGFNLFLDGNQLKLGAWRDSVGKWLTTEISAGETYHVVLSFDQGTLSGYVNGTEIGSVATGFEAMGPHAEDIGVAHMKGDTRFFSAIDTTPPIAEWTLDGLSSINSATASVIGSPTAVGSLLQNDAGSALSFNGSTDGVHIFDNAAINTSSAGYGQKTIELWFSPDRLTGRQVIYEQGDTAHGLNLYLDENVLKLGAWVNNIGEWLSATVALGQTYHAVLQFDQGILKGYVNGVYLGELSTDFNTIAAHNGDVAIGYSKNDARFSNDNDDVLSGDGHYFEGTIEGLKLYNKITSPEEIVYNYRNGTEQFIGEGNYFDGVVDDLKLYRTALSAAQVQDIYAAGTSAPDNSTTTVEPIARWNLDGNRQNSGTLGSAVALSTVTTTASPGYTQGLTPSSTQAIKLLERFNQGIKVTDHPALNTGGPYAQRTVELWFEANNLSGINMLYEEGGTGNGLNIFLNGNTLSLGVWQNNVGKWLSTTVNVNETYQVVFSFDQGQLHGYLNGKLFGTTTTAFNAIPTHTGDIGIGYNNGGTRLSNTSTRDTGNYFDGILDDIRIYDVALTDAEILDSYQSAQEYPGGKFAHWRLNGNLNNSVNVGSAINGSAVGSPQLGVPGLVPGSTATHFNGFSDGIAIPNNDAINTQAKSVYTIELWFSADNLEGQQVIYEQGGGVNGFNIYLDNAQLNLGAWANSTGEWLSTTVQANQRYYLVLSFDSGTLTGYLNGESIGSVETGFTEMPAHTGRVGIAMMQGDTRLSDTEALSGDGKYFQGTIDEVALYSKILSPEQVRANYISGFAQGLTVEIFNNPNLENDPIAVDRVSGLDNLSLDANTSKKITGYIKAPVTGTYTFTTTSTGGTRLSVDGNQLIDNWQNPEQVLDLDGANDYVEITNYGAMYNLAQAFTVEAWINIDEFDSVWQTIVATGNQSWRLHRNNNTNKIAFTVGNQENEVIRTVNSQTSFPDGQWHHLAGVYDGTNVHLYVDGVLEGSSNATIAFDVPDSNFNITIGYNPESVGINGETGRHFDGKIDEVKLWDRALTAAEIVNNLTTDLTGSEPDLVGYWDFDDSEGLARVIDRSANANHGRFRGVFDPTQTQLNNWSNKILTFEEDYSSHFQPSTQTASKTIDLVAGQLYEIEFQTQGFGNATSPQLQWSYPGINDQVISNSVLFTPPYTKVSWQVSGGQNGSTFYGTDQDGAWEFFNGDSDRYAISPTFDVSTGGRLTFDLVLGGNTTISTASADQTINNGGSPVSPNYPVRLEYSVNGGATWTEIERYNSESILSDGNWRSIIVDLPAEAESPQTQFRWFQADDSSTSYSVNNWALDNVTVIQEATDLWLDIEGGKVFTAQQETNTASTAISDGDALYFTADAFDIVNPLGEEFQYLLRENEANLIPGDFNGDGKTDFIRQQK
ncbi:MAG: LamG-like jellyroll fold domain-containing protein, partial [Prochlorotrichaceae cyanobacterium]